jgi:hypothetical protein
LEPGFLNIDLNLIGHVVSLPEPSEGHTELRLCTSPAGLFSRAIS